MIADIEDIVKTVANRNEAEILRADLVNILKNGLRRTKPTSPRDRILAGWTAEAEKFVKEKGKEVVIINADKGNKTVIMRRSEYDDKMRMLVSDESTYKRSSRDPTSRVQTQNNTLVKMLTAKGYIGEREKRALMCYSGVPPRLYGLPKVHKDNVPLRPVVSFIGSPNYGMAKFVSSLLSPLSVCHYNVRDSREVAELVKGRVLPEGYRIVSLDVVSLFTNVPVDFALGEIDRRFSEVEPHTKITKEDFLKLVEFCLTSGYFRYDGEFFLQLDGVAMGSPISPIVADVVLQRLLDETLGNSRLRIECVKKYVDDLLVFVHEDDIEDMLVRVNSFHPKLQFTLEMEKDNMLPYLDMKIHRDEGNVLSTTWYSKPCASGRLLNFNSGHSFSMIINVGRNLVKRVRGLTSKVDADVNSKLNASLKKNDFPPKIIRKLLSEHDRQRPSGDRVPAVEVDPGPFRSLVHIPGVSEKMKKRIAKSTDVNICLVPAERVKRFFTRVKDKLPDGLCSDVVYEIPCRDCSLSYVGTTGRLLKTRLQEHERSCRDPEKNKGLTSLCAHVSDTDPQHSFAFENTKVLDTHRVYSKRMMLEMLFIKRNLPRVVNNRSDVDGLSNVYAGLVNE
uniref:Putative reverse transcriptase n=1 Tax=Lutzomyia longipalpis TaxID=7200 RepID=A0A1B0CA35_LUTLO